MAKSKIIVCAHKKDFMLSNEIYQPLQVGKALSNVDLGFQGDDTGDNISEKNPNYCELTGLYWAWKNLQDYDYIGLAHYRRYFDFSCSLPNLTYIAEQTIDSFTENESMWSNPEEALKGYDIILPKAWKMNNSVAERYIQDHILEDFNLLCAVILKLYPDIKQCMLDYWFKDNRWIAYNMFFTRKDIFNDYCQWLFTILFEVEKYIKISGYPFQCRVFGFMSEIMLPLYCFYKGLNVKYCPVIWLTGKNEIPNSSKIFKQNLKSSILFKLSRPISGTYEGVECYFNDAYRKDGIKLVD